MNKQTSVSNVSDGNDQVVFAAVDAAVSAAVDAQRIYQEQNLGIRRSVIEAMRKAAIVNAERWVGKTCSRVPTPATKG